MSLIKQMENRKVNIGANTFYIRPLPAFKAAKMTGELASLVLPLVTGLSPLLAGDNKDKSFLDIDAEKAAPVIGEAFSAIDGDKIEKILKHLLIDGENVSYNTPANVGALLLTEDAANEIFCQEVQDMFLLAFEVIKTNYNGFFEKLGARFGERMTKRTSTNLANMAD